MGWELWGGVPGHMRNVVLLRVFSWIPRISRLQPQQPVTNHRTTCLEGTGRKENESRKYISDLCRLLNVKGFLFLICQSFQRSLTYAYSQPCSSPSQQVTEAAPQKPITAHLCWGCCCQSCKLAHLQPFIMQRSKEHNVVSFFFEVIQAVSSGVRHSGDRITCALNSHVYFALEFFQYFVWW